MKAFIVLSAFVAVAFARPGVYLNSQPLASVAYARLVHGAPIGLDGRVVDTPEVSYAKAEHAAAHVNERITLANEAYKNAGHVLAYAAPVANVASVASVAPVVHAANAHLVHPVAYAAKFVHGAPTGVDGRVVDTPEVSLAKAEHAAAHVNEKITLAHEAARSAEYQVPLVVSAYSAPIVQKYVI